MINLFSVYDGKIDHSKFKNLIYDDVMPEFEEAFAKYTGSKFVALISNATTAITLALQQKYFWMKSISIPTMIPHVVANAILASNNHLNFINDIEWIGNSYQLTNDIIDSAHRLDRSQFSEARDDDIMIFSFYPTKICGALCGAAVISNSKSRIAWFRQKSMGGMDFKDNRQIGTGYNFYMTTPQVYATLQQLKTLNERKERIAEIRDRYNEELGYNNTSDHLYRIKSKNRDKLISHMKENGVICGVHYECQHKNKIFHPFRNSIQIGQFSKSEKEARQTVSIPLHHRLSKEDVDKIIKLIQEK